MANYRSTHQWLKPLYDELDGRTPRPVQLSSSTGYLGVFGASGTTRMPTGFGFTGGAAQGGATGTTFFDFRTNGGTGAAYYNFTELVGYFKRLGWLPQ